MNGEEFESINVMRTYNIESKNTKKLVVDMIMRERKRL